MPALNTKKIYQAESYYHIYNRGVHSMTIFRQPKDYWRFRHIARDCQIIFPGIEVSAFSLMENHFHLLVFQLHQREIAGYMKALTQRYVLFFNQKYQFRGRLMESPFKGRLLSGEADREVCRQYILNNPLDSGYHDWKHVGEKI
jgi:REP element-mobilizing transposase RayT